jgi:hypothetical protein
MQVKFLYDYHAKTILIPAGTIAEFSSTDENSSAIILGNRIQFKQIRGLVDILSDLPIITDQNIIGQVILSEVKTKQKRKSRCY